MRSTRTSTDSLPKKQPTFAELQAAWSQKPGSPSTDVATAKAARKKKRSPDESEVSVAEASPIPEPKVKQSGKTLQKQTAKVSSSPNAKKARTTATATRPAPKQAAATRTLAAASEPRASIASGKTSFLSLPAEIRNEIYTLALVEPDPIEIRTSEPYVFEPALLATNRQVRFEALGVYYGESEFEIQGSSPLMRILRATTDDKLRALRCLRIATPEGLTLPRTHSIEKYIEDRIEQLLREFEPRGFGRQVLRFEIDTATGTEWVNLARLKRLVKRGEV